MKVVFAHDVILEKLGNSNIYYNETYNYTLWQRYLRVFTQVAVFCRVQEIEIESNVTTKVKSSGDNVQIHAIPSLSGPFALFKNRKKSLDIFFQNVEDADLVIARLPSEIGMLAITAAKKLKKPWVVEIVGHAWDSLMNYGNWQGVLYAPIMTWRTKQAASSAPYALYVTDHFLQKHYPSKGKMIGCSNVNISYVEDKVLERKLERIQNNSQSFTIGLIGYLSANYKGIDTAFRAILQIKQKFPNVKLRLLGVGDYKPWMEMVNDLNLQENVIYDGTLPSGEAIYNWLDGLDVYIQPSRQEGLPRALIEAMSRGLPAIGSTAGGIPELLSSACLIKPGDVKGLSLKILKLYGNKEWQMELAIQNFEKARQYIKPLLEERRTAYYQGIANFINGVELQ